MYSFKSYFGVAALFAVALAALAALASSCGQRPRTEPPIAIKVYSVTNGGFGYALYQGGRKIIDQPNVPAVQHLMSFRSRGDAESTAQLMSLKLESHQFPPTITIRELDSLQIRY
jgi:hypothetical protein